MAKGHQKKAKSSNGVNRDGSAIQGKQIPSPQRIGTSLKESAAINYVNSPAYKGKQPMPTEYHEDEPSEDGDDANDTIEDIEDSDEDSEDDGEGLPPSDETGSQEGSNVPPDHNEERTTNSEIETPANSNDLQNNSNQRSSLGESSESRPDLASQMQSILKQQMVQRDVKKEKQSRRLAKKLEKKSKVDQLAVSTSLQGEESVRVPYRQEDPIIAGRLAIDLTKMLGVLVTFRHVNVSEQDTRKATITIPASCREKYMEATGQSGTIHEEAALATIFVKNYEQKTFNEAEVVARNVAEYVAATMKIPIPKTRTKDGLVYLVTSAKNAVKILRDQEVVSSLYNREPMLYFSLKDSYHNSNLWHSLTINNVPTNLSDIQVINELESQEWTGTFFCDSHIHENKATKTRSIKFLNFTDLEKCLFRSTMKDRQLYLGGSPIGVDRPVRETNDP